MDVFGDWLESREIGVNVGENGNFHKSILRLGSSG